MMAYFVTVWIVNALKIILVSLVYGFTKIMITKK